ncbi:MAG: hypothetical protein A2Y24_05720 [Clostridiales bacterium GWE2_32_10]|nr:MAG: hypothetical protein A2Y24_05720 [Clostridiales bacterium GWE2_32_10]HBY20710.1 N-ethylammeline chlorohydrolase [Clostridiales bacterium]
MKILLKNADVVTVNEHNEVLKGYDILIKDDIIKSIMSASQKFKTKENDFDEVIDCTNKIIMPGFINCHTHTPMTLLRNYADDMNLQEWLFDNILPIESNLTKEMCYIGSKLAMLEMIKTGTTTFNDMYFYAEESLKAGIASNIRTVVCGAKELDYDYEEIKDLIIKYEDNKDIKFMSYIHSIYTFSKEKIQSAIKLAHEFNLPIHIHISETKKEVSDCIKEHGVTPVKYLESLGLFENKVIAAHCVHITDDDIEILKKYNVSVVHNPASNMKLASGIAPITKLIEAGVNVCLGTDGTGSNNNLDMLKELRLASYLQKVSTYDPTVIPADLALKIATVNGAKALGFEKLGQIKEGYKADLIILDANKTYYYPRTNINSQIVYSGNAEDVETVIIDGKIVMRNKEMIAMDEEKIKYEAQRAYEMLIKN